MPERLFSLRLYYFATLGSNGAYTPFFPRWLEKRGIDGLAMGATMALFPALSLIAPPVAGFIADALNLRGSLMRLCAIGACLAMVALALAGALDAQGFGVIFCAVLAHSAFRSPMGMMADVVALEHAAAGGTTYGRLRAWGSVGFLIVATLTGRLIDVQHPIVFPAIIGGILFVSVLASWTLPTKNRGPRLPVSSEASTLLRSPDYGLFLLTALLGQAGHSCYDLCISLHLRDLKGTPTTIGIAWAIGTLSEVVLMTYAAPLVARIGAPRLVGIAFLGAAMRWLLIASVRSLPVLLFLQPLHALTFGVWWVSSLAYTRERAPAHALATAQGLFTAAGAIGSVLGMLTWGTLYRRAGGAATFQAAAMVSLTAATVAVLWARRPRPLEAAQGV